MYYEAIAEPAVEPILLAELKDHLRIDGSDDDPGLGALITASRTMLEDHLNIAFIEREFALYFDQFPSRSSMNTWWHGTQEGHVSSLKHDCTSLRLPVRPLSSINSINVYSEAGTATVWGADNYYLKPGFCPSLHLKSDRRWPIAGKKVGGLEIRVTAGFGPDWNSVPAGLRQALLVLAAFLYSNRGEVTTENAIKASGAGALTHAYREYRL